MQVSIVQMWLFGFQGQILQCNIQKIPENTGVKSMGSDAIDSSEEW